MAGKSCCGALFAQWRLFAFVLVPLGCLPLPILWTAEAGKAAYILLVSSIFMVTEILPLSATVLFAMFLIPMTGVQTLQNASEHFATDIYFLFLGMVILATSIEEVNLHRRLALLTLKAIGASPTRLIFGFVFISGLLSMWLANAAVTVMILPIAIAVSATIETPDDIPIRKLPTGAMHPQSDTVDIRKPRNVYVDLEDEVFLPDQLDGKIPRRRSSHSKEMEKPINPKELSKALQLSVAYAANIGGLATLIGSHPNIIFRMSVETMYGLDTGLNFLTYMLICGPVALVSLFLTWLILSAIYIPHWCRCKKKGSTVLAKSHEQKRKQYLNEQYDELGPVRQEEVFVVLIFFAVVVMWLTRQPQIFPGWATLMPGGFATDSVPTLFAIVLLFVWPADFVEFAKGVYRPLMTWKRIQAKLPWDLLIFQGGISTISSLANTSGLVAAIGHQIPDLRIMSPWLVVGIICVVSSALTEFTNNSIITAIFIPVLAIVGEDSGVNPLYYMMAATLSSMFSFMIPISSFPTIIVYGYGTVSRRDMLIAGIGPKIVCIVLLILSLEFLGGFVLTDWKTFPNWANARLISRTGNTSLGLP